MPHFLLRGIGERFLLQALYSVGGTNSPGHLPNVTAVGWWSTPSYALARKLLWEGRTEKCAPRSLIGWKKATEVMGSFHFHETCGSHSHLRLLCAFPCVWCFEIHCRAHWLIIQTAQDEDGPLLVTLTCIKIVIITSSNHMLNITVVSRWNDSTYIEVKIEDILWQGTFILELSELS